MLTEHERAFDLFGSRVRLLIGAPAAPGLAAPELAAIEVELGLRLIHRGLSRFLPDSELSRLNRDSRHAVPASDLMLAFIEAATRAAELSDGLVDPTLLDELEAAGYRRSRVGCSPAPLVNALRSAPPRGAAAPDPRRRWRAVRADRDAGTVVRRPGIRLDSGGICKGLAADAFAARLSRYTSFAVDCGGDLRIGGANGLGRVVEVEHPLTGDLVHRFEIAHGAVATSGLKRRVWRCLDGSHAHHLIDPATGRPAWTGLIQATALAPTAVDAERLAKAALLSGPDGARRLLAVHGGALIDDRGEVQTVGAERAPACMAAAVR